MYICVCPLVRTHHGHKTKTTRLGGFNFVVGVTGLLRHLGSCALWRTGILPSASRRRFEQLVSLVRTHHGHKTKTTRLGGFNFVVGVTGLLRHLGSCALWRTGILPSASRRRFEQLVSLVRTHHGHKTKTTRLGGFNFVVGVTGFEPATSTSRT